MIDYSINTPLDVCGLLQDPIPRLRQPSIDSSDEKIDGALQPAIQRFFPPSNAMCAGENPKFFQLTGRIETLSTLRLQFALAKIRTTDCVSKEKVYLTSNEHRQKKILDCLVKEGQKIQGTTLLAVSGFFGLNAAAMCLKENSGAIEHIIIIDNSIRVQRLWANVEQAVRSAETSEEALGLINAVIVREKEVFWPISNEDVLGAEDQPDVYPFYYINQLDREIKAGRSWLSSQQTFMAIKRIFNENRFLFKRLNLFELENVRELSNVIRAHELTLGVVYLSNIREYAEYLNVLPDFHESFKCLQTCMTNETLIIDTRPRRGGLDQLEPLEQRIIRNKMKADIERTFPPSVKP